MGEGRYFSFADSGRIARMQAEAGGFGAGEGIVETQAAGWGAADGG
jgi:hypothetical protein